MKRLLVLIAAGLLLIPSVVVAEELAKTTEAPPPVSQTLVREGDFAFDLAVALRIGEPGTEIEVVDMLTNAGISPKNGWIADYPVTPDVLGELLEAVKNAAENGKIEMSVADAESAFRDTAKLYGLNIAPASDEEFLAGEYESEQVDATGQYYEPTNINNYYYDYGPPVVTYYSPPWDYWYLYSWVSYPFWCYGYYYPGYYILNDFRVTVDIGHRHRNHRNWAWRSGTTAVVSNHVRDRFTNTVVTINPVTRQRDTTITRDRHRDRFTRSSERSGFAESGRAILDRSESRRHGRDRTFSATGSGNATIEGARDRPRGKWNGRRSRIDSATSDTVRPRSLGGGDRSVSRERTRSSDRGAVSRSFDRPRSLGGGDPSVSRERSSSSDRGAVSRSFDRPRALGGGDRSVSRTPSTRSFERQSGGVASGRSFSTPSRSVAPARSSGNPSVGRGGGRGGGEGRGGGHRGCRGKSC